LLSSVLICGHLRLKNFPFEPEADATSSSTKSVAVHNGMQRHVAQVRHICSYPVKKWFKPRSGRHPSSQANPRSPHGLGHPVANSATEWRTLIAQDGAACHRSVFIFGWWGEATDEPFNLLATVALYEARDFQMGVFSTKIPLLTELRPKVGCNIIVLEPTASENSSNPNDFLLLVCIVTGMVAAHSWKGRRHDRKRNGYAG
jgi:hypothetical protein